MTPHRSMTSRRDLRATGCELLAGKVDHVLVRAAALEAASHLVRASRHDVPTTVARWTLHHSHPGGFAPSSPLTRFSEAQRQYSTESNEHQQDQDQDGLRVIAHVPSS